MSEFFTLRSHPGSESISRPKTDVLILQAHGDDGRYFLKEYGRMRGLRSVLRRPLKKYIALERDAGAPEVARAIGKRIARESELVVRELHVDVPRALIDLNRSSIEHALGSVWHFEQDPELVAEFSRIYEEIVAVIRAEIANLRKSGLVLGVHTMAAISPNPAYMPSSLTPSTMRQWIDAYRYASEQGGKPRWTDVISGSADGSKIFADREFVTKIHENMRKLGFPTADNDPYAYQEKMLQHLFLEQILSGEIQWLDVDLVKDALRNPASTIPFDLLNPEIDPTQVERIAEAIAKSVVEHLMQQIPCVSW